MVIKEKTEAEKHLAQIDYMINRIKINKNCALHEVDKGKGWQLAIEMLTKQKQYFQNKIQMEVKK